MSQVVRAATRILGSRVLLGACALVLAATAIIARVQQSQATGEAECRSDIGGYVEGLAIELDVAVAMGLLDRVGAEDLPVPFDQAVDRAETAARRLEVAKDYREHAVEVCASNPNFDPTTDIQGAPHDQSP